MKIETIRVKNFRTFKHLELKELPGLVVFVGANGSGKSTLFDVFGFLSDALKNNVRQALSRRGGFNEVRTRGTKDSIVIELQFRLKIVDKVRLVTYHLEIADSPSGPIVEKEILKYKRGRYGSPYHFLDFSRGKGVAITNEEDYSKNDEELTKEEQSLGSFDVLAIKGLGQFERFKAASAFREFIENWHVSDFHISEARNVRDAGYAEHLSQRGENLALVAQYLFENHPNEFDKVLSKMKARVPGVEEVKAETTVDGRIVLRFKDQAFTDPFISRYVSDGTIKMFAYLLLLHDPKPHPLLCVEEPENQLYPSLLLELLEEFRVYAKKGGQVFVTTHSPDLLNGAKPEEVFWLAKKEGTSIVLHAGENEEIKLLVDQGDQLGYLWNQGYFKGARP